MQRKSTAVVDLTLAIRAKGTKVRGMVICQCDFETEGKPYTYTFTTTVATKLSTAVTYCGQIPLTKLLMQQRETLSSIGKWGVWAKTSKWKNQNFSIY